MADLIQFDDISGARIGRVVREAENPVRRARPLVFAPILEPSGSKPVFRISSFTGPWSIGTEKVLTFSDAAANPNTASVMNLFWPISDDSLRDCSIAREGTAWYLLVPQLAQDTALSSATLGSSLEFGRISVLSLGTVTTVAITTTTCAT